MKPSRMNKASSDTIRVKRGPDNLRVGNCRFTTIFRPETGGFPAAIGFPDESPLVRREAPLLSAHLDGVGTVHPFLERLAPRVARQDDAVRLTFDDIPWRDAAGKRVEGFRLALEYEFFADGAVFVRSCFFGGVLDAPPLRDFCLAPGLTLPDDNEVNWAYWTFPGEISAKIIQDAGSFERGLNRGDKRRIEGAIAPFFSFDLGAGGRRDKHLEFFVESWNSLDGGPSETATHLDWQGRNAELSWNFQTRATQPQGRASQWRNTWGWCLRRFPVERRRTPPRVFHYLDNFTRYPTTDILRRIAATGADTLILHENWRLDLPGDAFPHDAKSLERTCRACRRYGLRLGLYVRGNEQAIRERLAEPLRPWLRRNIDGIYMDFGSPMCYLSREETAPGGRLHFREHYRMTRAVREFVGPDGFFISHSGSFFSAIGHTTVDAYLGGEQEKGRLIESPTLHGYFSGLSVAPSALWTAAFPAYRTGRALPYLAASGQTPFLHLGVQFPTSSLAHPHCPEVLTFARPLWRMWELLDGQRNLRFYSTSGGPQVLKTDAPETGASLFITRGGDALLILANYADVARNASVSVNWKALGLPSPKKGYRLTVGEDRAKATALASRPGLRADLDAEGLCGWLLVSNPRPWGRAIASFARPYPAHPRAESAWKKQVETIRRARFEPPTGRQAFMRVTIPNFANNYEDSIWYDLFDNDIELLLLTKGPPRRLGYVTLQGLRDQPPNPRERLLPGRPTPWLALHDLLPAGRHRLGLRSRRGDGQFYSFVQAELSSSSRHVTQSRVVEYCNEIDRDWSLLDFEIKLE